MKEADSLLRQPLFYECVLYFQGVKKNIVPGLICLIGKVSYILEECDGYKA